MIHNLLSSSLLLIFISIFAICGCFSRVGNYRVNYDAMEMKNLKPMNVRMLLPPEAKIRYFQGKYVGQKIERNEATIRLHTQYLGAMVEPQTYLYMKIGVWNKTEFYNQLEKRIYYNDPCQDFKKVKYPELRENETKHVEGDVTYYISPDRLFFRRDVMLDSDMFVIATADFDKRRERRDNYDMDIMNVIKILKSINKMPSNHSQAKNLFFWGKEED